MPHSQRSSSNWRRESKRKWEKFARKKKTLFSVKIGPICFITSFAYLFVFRTAHWCGLPTPYKTANAIQLIMTLKVKTLCDCERIQCNVCRLSVWPMKCAMQGGVRSCSIRQFSTSMRICTTSVGSTRVSVRRTTCFRDGSVDKSQHPGIYHFGEVLPMWSRYGCKRKVVSLIVSCYAFSTYRHRYGVDTSSYTRTRFTFPIFRAIIEIRMFLGPYYTFRVWKDGVENRHVARIDVLPEIVPRLTQIPLYIAMYLMLNKFLPLEVRFSRCTFRYSSILQPLHDDEFYSDSSSIYRFFFMTAVFYHLKTRVYTAWLLAECCCILAGVGAYPKEAEPRAGRGPSKEFKILDGKTLALTHFEAFFTLQKMQQTSSGLSRQFATSTSRSVNSATVSARECARGIVACSIGLLNTSTSACHDQ